MNEKLNFARKMFDLPIVGSGECYPHISYLPQHVTVGEALKLFELGGYHLTRILSPHILANDDCSLFKLRIVFVMERGIAPRIFRNCKREWETEMKQERAFIKGGFLFDTVDHFYEWRNAEG